MKKNRSLLYLAFATALLVSCQEKKELQEVQIPDASIFKTDEASNLSDPNGVKTNGGPFAMPGLSFQYNDLAPFLSAENIELHYAKHHLGYANNLNKAVGGTPLEKQTIEQILAELDVENSFLRNNAGGYYNHNLYWRTLSAKTASKPNAELSQLINRDFGSLDQFKQKFSNAATAFFGSGWVWLVYSQGKLHIVSTQNQDNPLMKNSSVIGTPLLGIDLWEHAYYPTHKNNRKEYVNQYLMHLNWSEVTL